MAALRIFLSHVNNDPFGDALLESLVTLLEGRQDCSTFVDHRNVEAGDYWQQRIYVALARCDAAILLISPRALAKGKFWVAREIQFLLWRKMLAPESYCCASAARWRDAEYAGDGRSLPRPVPQPDASALIEL